MKKEDFIFYKKRWKDIKTMRKNRYTQQEIAKKYGISRQMVALLEKKETYKIIHVCNDKCRHTKLKGRDRTRMNVRERDNFTCQNCGKVRTREMAKKEKKYLFDIHHLSGLCGKKSKGYDKMSEIGNLITLCHKCHFNHPEHTLKSRKRLSEKTLN